MPLSAGSPVLPVRKRALGFDRGNVKPLCDGIGLTCGLLSLPLQAIRLQIYKPLVYCVRKCFLDCVINKHAEMCRRLLYRLW